MPITVPTSLRHENCSECTKKNEGSDIDSINEITDNDTLLGPSETSSLSTETETEANCLDELKLLRPKYPRNVIISYININSISSKFSGFSEMIGENVDVSVIAETKIDPSFPMSQFLIDGFKSPYRLDVSGNSGGVLVYVKECLLSKYVNLVDTPPDIQVVPIEINVRKQKWLILPIYRPPQQTSEYFVDEISKLIDKCSSYDRVMVLGDFNLEPDDIALSLLIQDHDLYNMIKQPTCFNSSKGRCIDLIFTNRKHSFLHSTSFETGFSDHHHMIYTILKTTFIKLPLKKFTCQDYKNWSQLRIEHDLRQNLISAHPSIYGNFESISLKTLKANAPAKTKLVRANDKLHMNKDIRKVMRKRSILKKAANNSKREEDVKPWPNALDFSLYNARHAC